MALRRKALARAPLLDVGAGLPAEEGAGVARKEPVVLAGLLRWPTRRGGAGDEAVDGRLRRAHMRAGERRPRPGVEIQVAARGQREKLRGGMVGRA